VSSRGKEEGGGNPTRAHPLTPGGARRRLLSAAGMRVTVLPVSGAAALLLARTVSGEYGVDAYAVFTLVANLPFLLPISDLGLGAAVTNAAAALPARSHEYVVVRAKSQRLLIVVGTCAAAVALVLAVLGWWPTILGLPASASTNWGAAGALMLFAAALPAAIGARELLGLKRNTTVVAVQGLTSVISLVFVAACATWGGGIGAALVLSIMGLFVTNWLCWIIARMDPRTREARRLVTRSNTGRLHVAIWNTAVPMMIISLALPLTFQSARIVLSYASTLDELAVYSAAAMVYLPTVSVVMVAGRSLWGEFATARATSQPVLRLYKQAVILSVGIGMAGAAALVLLGPPVAAWATNYAVDTPWLLFTALGAIVVLQSVQLPAGMLLTDSAGLRFQAITTIVMAAISIPTSIFLASEWGAVGPALSTAFALLVAQTIPSLIRASKVARDAQ
jgi:O-antigen/teichoic acid export membrane protein